MSHSKGPRYENISYYFAVPHLPSGIDKPPDRRIGNNDHHTAPEQIGEDVSKGAVKHAQRNTDQDGTQGLPARKSPFLLPKKARIAA